MINSSEISVVIQGPYEKIYTEKCIKSVMKWLPDAEIIFSTWKGTNVNQLKIDKVIFLKDPGSLYLDEVNKVANNVNRQILSSYKGILQATRKYCLKFRSDMIMNDCNWLQFFEKYDNLAQPEIFKGRLLICNYYTRNPSVYPMPFHPSDWMAFGYTRDLRKYYDIPLMSNLDMQWFKSNQKKSDFQINCLSRFVPEQYIWITFLKRYYKINCDCYYDCTKTNIHLTEILFAKCFVILDYQKELEIFFPKYRPNRYGDKSTLIGHDEWKVLFDYHCLKKSKARYRLLQLKWTLLRLFHFFRALLIKGLKALHLKEFVKKCLNSI